MVSHAVWITWPSGLSDDKNLGLRARFCRDTESLGPRFSHDHDQILQQSSNSSCVSHTGASWCENFHRFFKSLCWLSMCRIPIPYPSTYIFYGIADTYMMKACFPSIVAGHLRTVSVNERRYVCSAPRIRSFESSSKWTFSPAAQIACWFLHITFQNSIIPTKSQQYDGLIFNIQQNGVK